MSIAGDVKDQNKELDLPKLLNAGELLKLPAPTFEPIIENVFDRGDKIATIGPSKTRKTFYNLQMVSCVSTGRDFLGLHVVKPVKTVLVQYEIQPSHFLQRLQRMCLAQGIDSRELMETLRIINARGFALTGVKGIDTVRRIVEPFEPEFVSFDPLYKLSEGVENAAEDMKVIMGAFDGFMGKANAGVGYVHHDAKGTVGDRDARDRGAGSGVIGRDYDAAMVLSPQKDIENGIMVELLLRNYKPIDPFVALFNDNFQERAYRFELAIGIAPETKKTAEKGRRNTKNDSQLPESFFPVMLKILNRNDGRMATTVLHDTLKAETGLSRDRTRAVITAGLTAKTPVIRKNQNTDIGVHESFIFMIPDPDFINE